MGIATIIAIHRPIFVRNILKRRSLFAVALSSYMAVAWGGTPEGDADTEPPTQPHYKVSAEQLQRGLAQRFPLRFPVPGMLNLDMQVPALRLLPAQNRLAADMVVDAVGPALQRNHQGTLELEFSLRYEASDRTVRAHQIRFKRLLFPTLQPGVVALLSGYGHALAERTLLEVVVHRLSAQDLALPDTMGLQPGTITVTDAGLTIGFVPKPPTY
jgi:hypothetical protein